LVAVLLLTLSACDAAQTPEAQAAAADAPGGPSQLWQVDVIGEDGKPSATALACVDDALREQFMMARAKVNGRKCMDITPPGQKARGWMLRCQTGGRWFNLSSAATGDETHDFTLDVAMTPVFPELGTVRQVRRFRRIGACPPGWRIGDQARPGEKPARRKAGT
jgi:hypothetical protein